MSHIHTYIHAYMDRWQTLFVAYSLKGTCNWRMSLSVPFLCKLAVMSQLFTPLQGASVHLCACVCNHILDVGFSTMHVTVMHPHYGLSDTARPYKDHSATIKNAI